MKKTFLIIFTIISLVFAPFANAARFGKGKSLGMQRSSYRQNYGYSNPRAQERYSQNYMNNQTVTPQQQPAPQPQHSGMGAGTAAMLGAAAGAAGGYLLGRNSNDHQQNPEAYQSNSANTNIQKQNASDNSVLTKKEINNSPDATSLVDRLPWGIITILGILLIIGLVIFKRKVGPELTNSTSNSNFSPHNPPYNENPSNNFSQSLNPYKEQQSSFKGQHMPFTSSPDASSQNNQELQKMPDGVEVVYFLRQAKGMFLHIQSMNNPENIYEIQKYLTPELYSEVYQDIADNKAIADFPKLEAELINCQVSEDNSEIYASVKFSGLISEEPDAPTVPFNEIWNFVKKDLRLGKWVVAGIEQVQ